MPTLEVVLCEPGAHPSPFFAHENCNLAGAAPDLLSRVQRCANPSLGAILFIIDAHGTFYRITQQPFAFLPSNVSSAARVAASNTSSTPSPVRDEHSRYFLAPISCATSVASLVPTNCCDFFRISSIATGSSRRSFFRPTSIIGTPGHRSFASSTH